MDYWPSCDACVDAAGKLLKRLPRAIPYNNKRHYAFLMPLADDGADPKYMSVSVPPDRNDSKPSYVETALLTHDYSVMYDARLGYADSPGADVRGFWTATVKPVWSPEYVAMVAGEFDRLEKARSAWQCGVGSGERRLLRQMMGLSLF